MSSKLENESTIISDPISYPKETIVLDRDGTPLLSEAPFHESNHQSSFTYSSNGRMRVVRLSPLKALLLFALVICVLAFGSLFFMAFLAVAIGAWALRRILYFLGAR